MTSQHDAAAVAHAARGAGLRDWVDVTLEEVDRRRTQLWAVVFVVMAGLAVGVVLLSLSDLAIESGIGILNLTGFRVGLLALTVAFAVYVIEKEVHLRRLTQLLIDERVLTAAYSNRVAELSSLARVARAVNGLHGMDETLDLVLASALELLGAARGSVLAIGDDGRLRVLASRGPGAPAPGERVAVGEGIAGRVAFTGEPIMAVAADGTRSLAAPLSGRAGVVGVLIVEAPAADDAAEYGLRMLALFAEHAGTAVANAELLEQERRRADELAEINRMRSDLVAVVTHELKTPLTAILGAARTLQRRPLTPDQRTQFLDMIEGQGQRLQRLIEQVLSAKRVERTEGSMEPVDVVAAAARVVAAQRAAGRAVEVHAPLHAWARATGDGLEQVLGNLVDNAFTHGAPPVEVEIELDGGSRTVRVSVRDQGEGVPDGERDRIFGAFQRGGSPRAAGTGLGLYVVRTLVESFGGKVFVTTRSCGGAVFEVELPVMLPSPMGVAS